MFREADACHACRACDLSAVLSAVALAEAEALAKVGHAGAASNGARTSRRRNAPATSVRPRSVEMRHRQPSHRAGDDGLVAGTQLHAEARVDAAQLQEAAAQRRAGQLNLAPIGEELTTTYANPALMTVEDNDLVKRVMGGDGERLKDCNRIDLAAVGPLGVGPVVE